MFGRFNDRVRHFGISRCNWSKRIQVHMIKYGSDEKDEGYDCRNVGNSCLLLDVSYEIVQAEGRKKQTKRLK